MTGHLRIGEDLCCPARERGILGLGMPVRRVEGVAASVIPGTPPHRKKRFICSIVSVCGLPGHRIRSRAAGRPTRSLATVAFRQNHPNLSRDSSGTPVGPLVARLGCILARVGCILT
jgi:hypothetical protein